MLRGSHPLILIGCFAISLAAIACGNKTEQQSGGSKSTGNNADQTKQPVGTLGVDSAKTVTGANGQIIDPEQIKQHYPESYCQRVIELKLRADVTEELGYFCPDGKPSELMLSMRQRLMDAPDGRTALEIITSKSDEKVSDYVVAWGYRVGIRPFEVKARPLYEFIAQALNTDDVKMTGSQNRRPDIEVDSGLHLWSVDMSYDLKVKATNGFDLTNVRKTQYNLYQVESGNEEMGFGVEALTEPTDFTKSTMLNLSFNDGQGFNDGKGDAIILNILHITLQNKGFPETAEYAIGKIGQFLADSMYQGLSN